MSKIFLFIFLLVLDSCTSVVNNQTTSNMEENEEISNEKSQEQIEIEEVQKKILSIEIETLPVVFGYDEYYGKVSIESFEFTKAGPYDENNNIVAAKIVCSVEDKNNEYLSFIIEFYDIDDFRIGEYYFIENASNSDTLKVEVQFFVPKETTKIIFAKR